MSVFTEMFFTSSRPLPRVTLRRDTARALRARQRQKEPAAVDTTLADVADADRIVGIVQNTLDDIHEIIGEPPPHVPFKEAAE